MCPVRAHRDFTLPFIPAISYLVLSSLPFLLSAWDRTDIIFRDSAGPGSYPSTCSLGSPPPGFPFPPSSSSAGTSEFTLFLYLSFFFPRSLDFFFSPRWRQRDRVSQPIRGSTPAFYFFPPLSFHSLSFLSVSFSEVLVHLFESITSFLPVISSS